MSGLGRWRERGIRASASGADYARRDAVESALRLGAQQMRELGMLVKLRTIGDLTIEGHRRGGFAKAAIGAEEPCDLALMPRALVLEGHFSGGNGRPVKGASEPHDACRGELREHAIDDGVERGNAYRTTKASSASLPTTSGRPPKGGELSSRFDGGPHAVGAWGCHLGKEVDGALGNLSAK